MTDTSYSSKRQRASRTDLINKLQHLNDTLDHTPTFQDMDEHGNYSGALYAVRFNSWNNALEAAGLESRSKPQQRYTDEELLNDLREFADTLGKTPSSKEMNRGGPYNSNTYKQRFGSWNNALREAGLEILRSTPSLPEDERKQKLLEDLAELAEDLEHLPTQKEIREYTDHSHTTYYNYWNDIEGVLRASDADLDSIDMERNTRSRSIETEDLFEELQRLSKELKRMPRWIDIRKHSKFSDSPYRSRFDSLEDAHREAGIPTNY